MQADEFINQAVSVECAARGFHLSASRVGVLLATLFISSTVSAEISTQQLPEGTIHPDRLSTPHSQLPEHSLPLPEVPPEFVLPPIKPTSKQQRQLSGTLKLWVNKIRLTGNTVFTYQDFASIIQHYEHREVTTEQLQQLRLQLSRYYVDRGYINSGALIPDQDIEQGIIQIQIIEGRLNRIQIRGNTHLNTDYIHDRIALGVATPLHVQALQQRLQLLKQDPLVEQINARLQPGIRPGESELTLQIEESRPYQVGLTGSNNRSPSIGAESLQAWAIHRNVTGLGDRLYASYSLTEGLDNIATSYSLPLNPYDTRLELSFNRSDSIVIESLSRQRQNEPKLTSQFESYQLAVTHPFYNTPQETLEFTVAFQHLRSQTFFAGIGTGFSGSGVQNNGKTRISALRLTQNWLKRSPNQVIAIRSRFSVGIDVLGVTLDGHLPDGRFFAWLGQFQWVRRLSLWDSLVIFRTDMQFSSEALLPLEKFSIGGATSVRGYRENQLVRDNGVSTSLEWRVPVFRLPVPILTQRPDEGQVHLAPFVDFGWSENIDLASPNPRTLASAGVGLRWNPSRKIHSQLYWAYPFRKIQNNHYDLQDSGLHFRVSMEFF